MTLQEFIKEHCMLCGTQRCNPLDPVWLEGCRLFRSLKESGELVLRRFVERNPKYNFYTDGKHKVIVTAKYAGQTFKGVAKCHPEDEFDEAYGASLAQVRCDIKIAKKKYKMMNERFARAAEAVGKANRKANKARDKVNEAAAELAAAENLLRELSL